MAFSEELRELAQRISNWGRWGDDDQRGTGNLLTPEAARRGAESVVDGTFVSYISEYPARYGAPNQTAGGNSGYG